MPATLSAAQARRVALAAQGFGRPQPGTVGTRQLGILFDRLKLLQLDSVNVFERSHYLPVFARLGPYDRALLDRMLFSRRGGFTEYWAHEAAVIRKEDWPLFRFRMDDLHARDARSGWALSQRPLLDELLDQLRERGPLRAPEIEHEANRGSGSWWGWSDVKRGLEHLFRVGEVVAAGRTRFERTYALPEQVLPAEVLERSVPREDAIRELVRRAAEASGVGTVGDLADYHRLRIDATKAAIADLVDAGELQPVTVEGWNAPAYLHRDARVPRRIETVALLSPFDPVVWERDRALRMFGFHYRIEIYTPAPKRVYGYYTLPLLVDDRLIGRIDLKSDRQAGVLRVQSAWLEEGAQAGPDVTERVLAQLHRTAEWQGLGELAFAGRGDFSPVLAAAAGQRVQSAS
ncbi:winged helix-turn-helix domain-containing protein [Herbiconiux sp. SYSU D00978]|uniref:winged helix-turn-helix domain-containing protein n=1 Tax=Herbiconiux sp. SYSU D00978 TaxID=2812562 RepID=UPI001A95E5BA|nr:crosslink repair DNA glycosylase YcaQ family protein [Herbiconiux sp. SYSU D00978]